MTGLAALNASDEFEQGLAVDETDGLTVRKGDGVGRKPASGYEQRVVRFLIDHDAIELTDDRNTHLPRAPVLALDYGSGSVLAKKQVDASVWRGPSFLLN